MESQTPPFKFSYNEVTKVYECQSQASGVYNNFYLDEIRHNSEDLTEFDSLRIENALTQTLIREIVFKEENKKVVRTYIHENNQRVNIGLKESTFLKFTMKGKSDKIISGITLYCGFTNKPFKINGLVFRREVSANIDGFIFYGHPENDERYRIFTSQYSSYFYLLDGLRNRCYEIENSNSKPADHAFLNNIVAAYEIFISE